MKRENTTPPAHCDKKKESLLNALLRKCASLMLRPYRKDLGYTLLLLVLISSIFIGNNFNFISTNWTSPYSVYLLLLSYLFAYTISLLSTSLGRLSAFVKPFVLTATMCYSFTNIFCLSKYKSPISPEFVTVAMGTNPEEAKEFFSLVLDETSTASLLAATALVLLVITLYVICEKRNQKRSRGVVWAAVSVLLLAVTAVTWNKELVEVELGQVLCAAKPEEVVDLRKHKTHPVLTEQEIAHPANIVILLGESFSKSHSSLYGYQKQTNPRLSLYVEDSSMVVFSQAKSPATSTTQTFKYILNNHTRQDEEHGVKWYESTSIIEALQSAGYHATWISNQAENGIYDNLPSGHSKLCDESYFSGGWSHYDDYLLSVNADSIKRRHPRNVFFFHFMGQHEVFKHRYPSTQTIFHPSDYPEAKQQQRQNLADYDNATLYNDYVASEIIKEFASSESVVVYLSDHALDIYNSDDSYCGHSRKTPESERYGLDVPFMVYVSASFDKRRPEVKEKLLAMRDKPLNTENLIHLVLDIAGWKLQQQQSKP